MAMNAYLTLKGRSHVEIAGSVTQKGREGSIMVIAYSHTILTPRDPASGLPTGKRQHRPLSITKEIDRSSPLLYGALVTKEVLSEWTLRFWQPSQTGREQQHYTIELHNATIAEIESLMLDNKVPANAPLKEREIVTFAYESITWTWNDGGITSSDTWDSPGD